MVEIAWIGRNPYSACGRGKLDEAIPDGKGRGGSSVLTGLLVEDVGEVIGHGLLAQVQLLGNLGARQSHHARSAWGESTFTRAAASSIATGPHSRHSRIRGGGEDHGHRRGHPSPAGAEEVAQLATYLCTDAASGITGSAQMIDCGWTAH